MLLCCAHLCSDHPLHSAPSTAQRQNTTCKNKCELFQQFQGLLPSAYQCSAGLQLPAPLLYSTLSKHPVPPTWDSKIHKATLYQECTRQRVAVSSDVWVNCIKRNLTPAGELSNEEFSPSQPCVCTIPFFWWFGIAIPSLGKL